MLNLSKLPRVALAVVVGLSVTQVALAAPQRAQGNQGPDKVKKTWTISGLVVGYEIGDYVHAVVKAGKKEESFYIAGGPQVGCFLANHLKKPLTLTIRTINSYVEEAGARMDMDQIVDARMGKLTAAAWWKVQLKKSTVDKLLKKANEIEEKNSGSGRPMRLVQPQLIYAINGWVFATQTGGKFAEPTKDLDGQTVRFDYISKDKKGAPVTGKLEYSEDAPLPLVSFELKSEDLDSLCVSGGKASLAKLVRISESNKTYQKVAKEYAAMVGKGKLPTKLQGGIQCDLNGDGTLDVVLAVSSGATQTKKSKADYADVLVRTIVGGKLKTITIVSESDFGLQRGPFDSKVIAAGDFDGDGKTEFVLKTSDAWGDMYRILQLGKDGAVKKLFSNGRGE